MSRGWRTIMAGVAVLAFIAMYAAGHAAPRQAWAAYLVAWLPLLAIPLGSLSLLMIHALTGGAWGRRLQGSLLAGTRLLPAASVLLLPLLFAARSLLPWWTMSPDEVPTFYLDPVFFYVRAVVCLLLWLWLWRGAVRRIASGQRWEGFAAGGLILLLLSATATAADWVMSLVPHWHSSAIGMLWFTCQLLVAFTFSLVLQLRHRVDEADQRRDFASLLLAMLLGWAYLAFMDYLTAWIADLPADTVWYRPRLATSWHELALLLVVVHLVVPFFLLLSRRFKARPGALRVLALGLLVLQWLYAAWLVLPSLRQGGMAWYASDLCAWLGVLAAASLSWRGVRAEVSA